MFLLFGGRTYYSAGGWNDYLGSYFTVEEAVADGLALYNIRHDYNKPHRYGDVEWFHVVDIQRDEIVHKHGDNYS